MGFTVHSSTPHNRNPKYATDNDMGKRPYDKGYLPLAELYYKHMVDKNFEAMAQCLHPDVLFIGPLAEMSGREAVVSAAKNVTQILQNIEIRSKFSSTNQCMLAYDFMFPAPMGKLRVAVLMEFKDHLIAKIELFYDGRPLEQKGREIFANT